MVGCTHALSLQQSCVGEQEVPSGEQVGGGLQVQPVELVQTEPVASRQVVFSPAQHACVGEQGSSVFEQVAIGTSQTQLESPAGQACWLPVDPAEKQVKPEQQAWVPVPPPVHCWPPSAQVAALTQTPPAPQVSPPQHATVPPQAWFRSAQLLGAAWQVPAVAPAGTLQERPKQQSAETVQASVACWQ